jgi:uncharacterized protein (TIGR02186 family)
VNRTNYTFEDVPAFLAFLATRPIHEVAIDIFRKRYKIDFHSIVDPLNKAPPDFQSALLELEKEHGLFLENPQGITFITPTVFRTSILLPEVAPTGTYNVEASLLVDGILLAKQPATFEVQKIGFEQAVVSLAYDHAWLYGFLVACMALFFGWLGPMLFYHPT